MAITPVSVRVRAVDLRNIYSFVRLCYKLARRSGIKYVVLYLKASQVLLMQAVGGHKLCDTRGLKVAVRRSRSGFPALIPRESRMLILSGSRRELRIWMTLLGLYRVLGFEGVVSTDTITKPGKIIPGEVVVGFQRFIHDRFWLVSGNTFGFTPMVFQSQVRTPRGRIPL